MKIAENNKLFEEVKSFIYQAKSEVSQHVNTELILMYWHVGKSIKNVVLDNKRADYGKFVINNLAQQLTFEFGRGWSNKTLLHCLHFVETFQKLHQFYLASKKAIDNA